MLRERLGEELKSAMKAQDRRRTTTIRLILAAVKDRDLALHADSDGRDRIGDAEIAELLTKMVKQRQEASATYAGAGRNDLVTQEQDEIAIIREFLPQQLSEEETRAAVIDVIADLNAGGLKDMGRVMAALKERHAGRMDFARASAIAKELL
ncbi:MAG: GatB/YqeY domain-containing protein [Hyphomicrobiaceae bacterium]